MYVGKKLGSSVAGLIDKVITNNKTNENHILTVVYKNINTTDVAEIRSIKNNLCN